MPSTASNSALRVLVVEDEPLIAGQLEAVLADLAYQVIGPAPSVATALTLARTAPLPPSVALIDINLGGRGPDGIDLARQLLAERPLPLVFLASQADAASFARAQQLGPAAYIVKPVDPTALQQAIELAVVNFAAIQQLGGHAAIFVDEEPGAPSEFAIPDTGFLLPQALFLKEEGLLVKVLLNEISWITADEGGCRLALSGGRTVQVRQTLRELTDQLPGNQFVQIQRSYIINANCIERIDPVRNIVQVSGQLLPLSRSYRDELLKRLRLV
jgi:DNA-binding LytR/AlgR family response regulator